ISRAEEDDSKREDRGSGYNAIVILGERLSRLHFGGEGVMSYNSAQRAQKEHGEPKQRDEKSRTTTCLVLLLEELHLSTSLKSTPRALARPLRARSKGNLGRNLDLRRILKFEQRSI